MNKQNVTFTIERSGKDFVMVHNETADRDLIAHREKYGHKFIKNKNGKSYFVIGRGSRNE